MLVGTPQRVQALGDSKLTPSEDREMRGLARRALGGSKRAPDLSSASPGFLGGDLEVLRGTRRTTARLQALSSPLAGLAPVTLTSLLVPYLSPS